MILSAVITFMYKITTWKCQVNLTCLLIYFNELSENVMNCLNLFWPVIFSTVFSIGLFRLPFQLKVLHYLSFTHYFIHAIRNCYYIDNADHIGIKGKHRPWWGTIFNMHRKCKSNCTFLCCMLSVIVSCTWEHDCSSEAHQQFLHNTAQNAHKISFKSIVI